jgi:hypothetical protein
MTEKQLIENKQTEPQGLVAQKQRPKTCALRGPGWRYGTEIVFKCGQKSTDLEKKNGKRRGDGLEVRLKQESSCFANVKL